MSMKKAVVLLSGGLDSSTVLAIARGEGYECHALSFRYGQRHGDEIAAASRIAKALGAASHRVADLDFLRAIGGSALTDDIEVPASRPEGERAASIPVTYVPARNTIFLSLALAWADVLPAEAIFLGVNAVDYSGYPDCRPEFVEAFERLANLATRAGVEGKGIQIRAPLLHLRKAEIIRRGASLGVDYGLTRTCYALEGDLSCGACEACQLRLRGFEEAGLVDPAPYLRR